MTANKWKWLSMRPSVAWISSAEHVTRPNVAAAVRQRRGDGRPGRDRRRRHDRQDLEHGVGDIVVGDEQHENHQHQVHEQHGGHPPLAAAPCGV
jgi:hypothetical protein